MREQHGFAKEQPDSQAVSSGSPISGAKPYTSAPSALQRFGNYDLAQRIGIGGMGEVYLARQRTAFGREVAVKIIRSDLMHDITIRKRFLREAEVNAYLKHDHILPLVEFGEEQGRLFLVTPYIKGGTLSKRLKGGALTLAETYDLFTALAQAVAYLHKRGVIHRDLKPSNIMLDHEEGSEHIYVRLIDFGIAALQGVTASAPLTTAGHEMGTEAYMAPERLTGTAAPSNDIYSLGIILYQMLTGKMPEDEGDVMLPEPLIDVVEQSIVPDPNQRYQGAEVLLRAFEHAYKSLSLSHFRLTSSSPDQPPVGRNTLPSSSPPARSTTAQPQTSSPVPVPPTPGNPTRRPLPPSAMQIPARAAPDTPNLPPLANRLNSTDAQYPNASVREETIRSRGEKRARPFPTSFPLAPQNEDIAQPTTGVSQPYNPARLHAEVILPPLPDKTGPFKDEDYEAPTSYVAPEPAQKGRIVSEGPDRSRQNGKAAPPPKQKKRGVPIFTIVSGMIIVIVLAIGVIGYSVFQSANTATITIAPPQQPLNNTFPVTAKLNQTSPNINDSTLPLKMLTSTKSESKQGNTTGQTGCILGIIDCKQAVSGSDIQNLDNQIRPDVKAQIQQDLQQQEQQHQGITLVGDIIYTNDPPTANPSEGNPGNSVTVTVKLQGAQEYIDPADARTFAQQMFQKQLQQNWALVGTPQVTSVVATPSSDTQSAQVKIVATGVSKHNTISSNDLSDIAKQIAGKSQDAARQAIASKFNLDPTGITISISNGGNLPTDVNNIKFNQP